MAPSCPQNGAPHLHSNRRFRDWGAYVAVPDPVRMHGQVKVIERDELPPVDHIHKPARATDLNDYLHPNQRVREYRT